LFQQLRPRRHSTAYRSYRSDPADTDNKAAAIRELAEEAGLVSDNIRLVGSMYANPANQTNRAHTYLALDVVPQHTGRSPEEDEFVQVEIADFVDFMMRVSRGNADLQGLHLGALHLAMHAILGDESPRLAVLRRRLVSSLVTAARAPR
jgi:8-oxo-dGTP pyrophosphatase MutT (NUDIX family)